MGLSEDGASELVLDDFSAMTGTGYWAEGRGRVWCRFAGRLGEPRLPGPFRFRLGNRARNVGRAAEGYLLEP